MNAFGPPSAQDDRRVALPGAVARSGCLTLGLISSVGTHRCVSSKSVRGSLAVHPWLRLHEHTEVDFRELPAVADWFARCSARPAVARAYEKTDKFRAGFEESIRNALVENLDRIFGRKPSQGTRAS